MPVHGLSRAGRIARSGPAEAVRSLAAALLDLALPAECAACGEASDERGPVCAPCSRELAAGLAGGPRHVQPDPVPEGMPPVLACGPYAGPLRRLVTAYKDEDRRDVRAVLSPFLADALAAATRLAAPTPDGFDDRMDRAAWAGRASEVLVVPTPSSRAAVRRRGDDPVADLARAAATLVSPMGTPLTVVNALRVVRRVADQSRLGQEDRARNLAHAYAVRPRFDALLHGRKIVLVDDVLTTGATLAESTRALQASGAVVVAAATLAATRRRSRRADLEAGRELARGSPRP